MTGWVACRRMENEITQTEDQGPYVMLPRQNMFVHRENPDGTIDSVCRACFATVGTSAREADLEPAEKRHACDPALLERWQRLAARKSVDGPEQP